MAFFVVVFSYRRFILPLPFGVHRRRPRGRPVPFFLCLQRELESNQSDFSDDRSFDHFSSSANKAFLSFADLGLEEFHLLPLGFWTWARLPVRKKLFVRSRSSQYTKGIGENIRMGFGLVAAKNSGRIRVGVVAFIALVVSICIEWAEEVLWYLVASWHGDSDYCYYNYYFWGKWMVLWIIMNWRGAKTTVFEEV